MPHPPAPRLLFAVTTDLCFDQRMQRICNSLAAAGYRVQLVGWQRPGSPPLLSQPYQQHRLRGWFQKGKLFYVEYNVRLLLFLLGQRAAAWCAADLDTALPVWLRAKLGGQPFVYDAHELFTEVPEVVARPAVQRIWRWVEGFIVPRARLAYTVGPALARVFEQRYGRRFAVVRNVSRWHPAPPEGAAPSVSATPVNASSQEFNAFDTQFYASSTPVYASSTLTYASPIPLYVSPILVYASPVPFYVSSKQFYASFRQINTIRKPFYESTTPLNGLTETINASAKKPSPPGGYLLYQGALNVGRGLENLLEAMPQVAGRLVICGEGDLSAALRERAGRLGLLASGQVEFRGFVLPDALREVTRHAAVGIMLLENIGLSYYYSLANKFFDYVHAGIPQVLIDFPEYRALNDQFDVAELVTDLQPATLARALNRLLRDEPARYQHLAENCRRAAPQLSWQHEERELLRLWGGVVPVAGPSPAARPSKA